MSARTVDTDTADLAAVRADDALLDVLGGRVTAEAAALADDELSALLLGFRRDCDAPAYDSRLTRRTR